MAKNKTTAAAGPKLFETHEREHVRRIRRQRALFIPRLVREVAENQQLAGSARDQAHKIVVQWADLESSGKLAQHKETSIDTQFLDQIFGDGLGYLLKTKSPNEYHLEHKFTVKGIGTADAVLGEFPLASTPAVVIELKDANTDLDRDRSNGRTAVQQCWDYLNYLPNTQWGIVSNFSTIRLYHKSKGPLNYEEYALQDLRDEKTFKDFYAIFERGGLLTSVLRQPPRAVALLQKTEKRQKEVGDDLYKDYQWRRLELIEHLMKDEGKPLDEAIAIAQKILDRIIFIAFCEDRKLLPEDSLAQTKTDIRRYSRARNPAWENFLDLFKAIDQGAKGKQEITAFNGGLFKDDPAINALDLEDERWTNGFASFGTYDFSQEVNVEVLGHLFERSITELEKLRVGGLFALKANIDPDPSSVPTVIKVKRGKAVREAAPAPEIDSPISKMPKSAQRKRFGIYYTPPAFTGLIVERTVDALVAERFAAHAKRLKVDPESREEQDRKKLLGYWQACLDELKTLTVCDPACGSGAFLIRAYDALDAHYKSVAHGLAGAGMSKEDVDEIEDAIPDLILKNNLYGVDLSREGVEITQLALWIRSARVGKTLADLSTHIIHGNSLVSDPSVDPKALDWSKAFPQIFGKGGPGGFSCVIGNPPWERVKFHHREFFSLVDPDIAAEAHPAEMRRLAAELEKSDPDKYQLYRAAEQRADNMIRYARESGDFPLTATGDINLYMLFAERAKNIVASDGLVGLLVPSGIATDDSTKDFFADLVDRSVLSLIFDFENRNKVFEDVDGRFKFSSIVFGGVNKKYSAADFVFFAHGTDEVADSNRTRHIPLSAADMKLLNPNTRTCPVFRTRRDADLTKSVYKRVPILLDETRKSGGNPWNLSFLRMFDQSSDAEHFVEPKDLKKRGYSLEGNVWKKAKKQYLPLYEAKMVQAFDHRASSIVVEGDNWIRKGQKAETSLVEHMNPEFVVLPRWWVESAEVANRTPSDKHGAFMAFKNVTSPTNSRTMIASFVPVTAIGHSSPLIVVPETVPTRTVTALLANLNSYAYDFIARQKVGGVNLSYFIIQQLPTFTPDTYADKCPWSKKDTLEHWISERVLKLSCTAEDMIPLADACGFKGSRGDGVHIWKEKERAEIRAELDAAYFILYGIDRPDVEYILSTFTNTGFIEPDKRDKNDPAWEQDKPGAMILDAYDHLTGLSSAR